MQINHTEIITKSTLYYIFPSNLAISWLLVIIVSGCPLCLLFLGELPLLPSFLLPLLSPSLFCLYSLLSREMVELGCLTFLSSCSAGIIPSIAEKTSVVL